MTYFQKRRAEILGPRKRRQKVTLARLEQQRRYSAAANQQGMRWAARRLEDALR